MEGFPEEEGNHEGKKLPSWREEGQVGEAQVEGLGWVGRGPRKDVGVKRTWGGWGGSWGCFLCHVGCKLSPEVRAREVRS